MAENKLWIWALSETKKSSRIVQTWAYVTQITAEDFLPWQVNDRISKKIRSYCHQDGQANSGGRVQGTGFDQISRWKSLGPGWQPKLPREEHFKGRRNKSELSGSSFRGKQVFCELQFQSLICSHNKEGIIRRRGNLRSSFHPNPPTHTHTKPPFQIGPPHYSR